MSDSNIEKALFKRLEAMTPAIPTAWPNKPLSKEPSTAWQRVTLLRADNETKFIGSNNVPTLKKGILVVQLQYPVGEGSGAATLRAEAIQAQFNRGRKLTQGDTSVTIEEKPSIKPAQPGADWYVLPVHIPFYTYDYG